MGLIYVYDGSFEGLLSAVFDAYSRREQPDQLVHGSMQAGLMDEFRYVSTDAAKFERVMAGIKTKMGAQALEDIYMAFLTPGEERGGLIYEYLRLGFQLERRVVDHYENPAVMRVVKLSKRVATEIQHLKGFVRFRLVGGIYYSAIEPDNDVLELLAPHFAERFNDQRFIIEDKRRDKIIVSANGEWTLHYESGLAINNSDGDEAYWNSLWKQFHQSLAIKERRNPRQQRTMMPRRYWKHMSEMEGFDPLLEENARFLQNTLKGDYQRGTP